MQKNEIEYIWKRFKLKYPETKKSKFLRYIKDYENLKPFKANQNIFDTGQDISNEVHFILRTYSALKIQECFQAMKIDLNDPNVVENLEDGNIGTPARIAKMWVGSSVNDDSEMGSGRFMKPVRIATFPNNNQNNVPITKRVSIIANCSHHTAPFSTLFDENSYAIVSYIPDKFVLGISKLQRLVDFVSRRFWLQEDLTKAIFDEISSSAQTEDVYIAIFNVKHTCEWLRGSKSQEGGFTSEYYGGKFKDENLRLYVRSCN